MTSLFEWGVFVVGLAAGFANSVGILASAAGSSDYYPPGERNWQWVSLWGLSGVVSVALLVLGILQWRAVAVPTSLFAVGVVLFVGGFAVALAAGRDLGTERTSGMTGGLHTGGWYRYSRNPQYVGYIVATVAYPLVTGAPLVVPLVGVYLLWWLTFPLAEERWLRDRHGRAFEAYADRVPRFVGRHTVAVALGRADVDPSHDGDESPPEG